MKSGAATVFLDSLAGNMKENNFETFPELFWLFRPACEFLEYFQAIDFTRGVTQITMSFTCVSYIYPCSLICSCVF